MPLEFSLVCDLLEECHELALRRSNHASSVEAWFRRHRARVDAHDTSTVALLSTLLPDKRSDRVYCIQASRLEKIIGRGLGLGSSRISDLKRYSEPDNASDLADCVERVMNATPMQISTDLRVTVEEVDETLHGYASTMKWSSPVIRSQSQMSQRNQRDLELIYQRLTPREGKWFTRLILKNYSPLCFDSFQIYRLCDPLLPSVLSIRGDFDSAISVLESTRSTLLPNSTQGGPHRKQILAKIKPQLGIKVGRQHWMKARSIKHCLSLGRGQMSVEDKIDGEYCQIHIDLSKGASCIQVFSKSGKDRTEDCLSLHGIIKDSLRLGKPDCKFRQGCIVEGELVIFDDLSKKILPFHKIRNHVTRRGRFLNTDHDDLPTAFEHIMIIYYDALMIDEESLLNTRHSRRFEILKDLVDCRKGWAELVHRRIIDFGGRLAASDLRNVFAKTITSRQEGLVLKPDEPYFDFMQGLRPMGARCIKLKKEYIGNFGDIGDFAAVGAGYDPVKAKSYRIPNLKWTHFYVGTLDNKEQVQRWKSKPLFTVVAIVELNETLLKSVILHGNPMPLTREDNTSTELNIPIGVEKNPRMTVAFANPLVFDLRCFSFDKEGNTGFWSPRFPAVTKVHLDRDFAECLSFQELQELALENTTIPELPDSQENLEWIARLEAADPRGIAVDAMSEASLSTVPTPSPRSCNQNTEKQSPIPASFIVTASPEVVALKPNRAFAVSYGQLVTPPTSSAPEESMKLASLQNQEKCAHKRPLSTRIGHATPSKKRRLSTAHAPARSSSIGQSSASPARKPLGDINGNSSQLSASSSHMATNHGKQEVIDLTSSPENSFQESVAGPLIESCEGECSSQESELVTVFLPDSPRSFNDENDIPSSQLIAAKSACQFVGKNCRFANTHIILSPCLVNPIGELAALFEEHGLIGVTMTINEWLGDHGNFGNIPQLDGVPKKTIVLVDCLEHATEMKTAMKVLDGHRSKDMLERQEWITAYDWRVLRYISILEDETKTKKYYDGFTSPWTRWFCGLV